MEVTPNKPVKTVGNIQFEFNLKSVLNKYLNHEDQYEFSYFLSSIKQNQSIHDFIKTLLHELKNNVDILEPSAFESNLINVIFYEIKWSEHYSNDPLILTSLTEFLIDLNSAYTSYNYKCLMMLVKIFTVVNSSSQSSEGAEVVLTSKFTTSKLIFEVSSI